jgi:hypothetical protein
MNARVLAAYGAVTLLLMQPLLAQDQDQRSALLAAEAAASKLSSDSGLSLTLPRVTTRDAVLLWPGAPVVVGSEDIGRLLSGLPNRDSLRLSWQPLGVELARDSSLAVTWGVAVASPRMIAGPPRIGRYMTAWRREPDGWKIAALQYLGISALPAEALPSGLRLTQDALKPSGRAASFAQADLAFARLAGDSGAAVAFRRWAAPDAITLGGGSGGLITRGPDAIARAVDGPAVWQWHPVAAGASRSGELGWTAGEAVISAKGEEPFYSKYLTVWTRGAGGVRFLMDGGSGRPKSP